MTTGWNGPSFRAGTVRYLTGGYGASVRRWRLHVANRHPRYGYSDGPFELESVSVGPGEDGAWRAGEFSGEPVRLVDSSVSVGDGGEWVSEWLMLDLRAPLLVQVEFAAEETSAMLAPCWVWDRGGRWRVSDSGPLWIWLEAEVSDSVPVVAVLGDSTGAGQGADLPLFESSLAVAGRRLGFLPVFYAHSGDTLGENMRVDAFNYRRWADFSRADAALVQAGSNDLHSGASLESLQKRFAGVVEAVRSRVSGRVLACTIKPRFPDSDVFEGVRAAYNEWLLGLPHGIEGVVDTAARIGDSKTPVEFAADAGHLTTAGHAAMAGAFVEAGELRSVLRRDENRRR
ncbi:SGNH/GDSL hydrolase family protein [Corynebacterium halotolerans]|uniref:SGNH/GDSL hydrolase family protein n=1 Tax=Corynebacterium halotolerans TaxID=225326 RepID=UPI001B7FECC1|nr:SGNH/GDSL hydrolase family protein [Corynebacterium halotolerans]